MESRMEKYDASDLTNFSRTEKNRELYESVKASSMEDYDINSNVQVLDDNANKINVARVKEILDKRYSENSPKRISIKLPDFDDDPIIDDTPENTKEYDLNAVLEKAKQGKNIDYNQERLKKVRETQYEILNNLDLELKNVEEPVKKRDTEQEKNLMSLINTITELETEYKTSQMKKETSEALDLLSDLADDSDDEPEESVDNTLENKDIENKPEETEEIEEDDREETREETLTKLKVNKTEYSGFEDVQTASIGSIILKIFLILVIIALVAGAIYILDNILSLGLF